MRENFGQIKAFKKQYREGRRKWESEQNRHDQHGFTIHQRTGDIQYK